MIYSIILNGFLNLNFFKIQLKTQTKKIKWIGVDRGALIALKNNLPLTLAIGDFDSVNHRELIKIKTNSKYFIKFSSEKDQTDFELALDWLLEQKNINFINVYGWNGGRIDQLLSNLSVLANPKYKDIINKIQFIDETNWAKLYLPGNWTLKPFDSMKYIGFYTLTPTKNLLIKNFKYELKSNDVLIGNCFSSNEFLLNKIGNFSFESGILLVLQSKDIN